MNVDMSKRLYPEAPRLTDTSLDWYLKGFALGAGGANPRLRKGKPRNKRMEIHWRVGIGHGRNVRNAFAEAYAMGAFK